jgi:hypothetical protein
VTLFDLTRAPVAQPAATVADQVPFWGTAPDIWDRVFIAGYELFGIAKVSGSIKRRSDHKAPKGINIGTTTYLGDAAAEWTVALQMWTGEHLQVYERLLTFLRRMQPALTQTAQQRSVVSKFPGVPVEVRSPALDLFKIRAGHVLEYSIPEPDAQREVYTATMHFREFDTARANARGGIRTPKGAVDVSIESRGPGAIGQKIAAERERAATPVKPSQANNRPTGVP